MLDRYAKICLQTTSVVKGGYGWKMQGNKWFTIYTAKTDEIVALGTQRDCSITMNKKLSDITTLIYHVKIGRNHAYTIAVEDKETGEYCVYGAHNNLVADGRGRKKKEEII